MGGFPDIMPIKKDPEQELKSKYRIVFDTDMGREVLADILTKLKFGCYLNESMGDIALYNVAVEILAMLGIIGPNRQEEIIKALCSIMPIKEG